MCGDTLDAAVMACLMAGQRAALAVTDPRYNVAYEGKSKHRLSIINDAMPGDAYYQFLLTAFGIMLALSEDGGLRMSFMRLSRKRTACMPSWLRGLSTHNAAYG